MKYSHYLILVLLIATSSCKNKSDEGVNSAHTKETENVKSSTGQLNIMGYFVEPKMSGNLYEDGTVDLELPENFDLITKNAFEKYNNAGDAEYELSPMSFNDLFINLEGVEISGENAQIALAGKYYGYEVYAADGIKKGTVYPTSSLEYMEGIKKPESSVGTAGHHFIILYLNQEVKIQGEQLLVNFLNDNPDQEYESFITYDLELHEGWNVFKHSITDFIEDGNGGFFPVRQEFSNASLESIDNWEFLPL